MVANCETDLLRCSFGRLVTAESKFGHLSLKRTAGDMNSNSSIFTTNIIRLLLDNIF